MSDFRLDTGRAVVDTLVSLFSRAVGKEGCCKQILLACACSVSSTLGLPLLATHTAQALRSSAGEPSEAGPRLHAPPGLSRSGSALRKPSEAQIWLGLRFVPFPGPSGSGVGRAPSLRLWPFPAAQFPGSTAGAPSQEDDDRPEPPEGLVSKEACLHFGRQCLSWAAIAPFQPLRLWLPVTGGVGLQLAISVPSFVLCAVLVVSYVRVFHVVYLPQSGLLAQVSLLCPRVRRSGLILNKALQPAPPAA